MGSIQNAAVLTTPSRTRLFFSAARYLAGKASTIGVTIFVGVFVTLLIVGYPGGGGIEPGKSPFELRLETQIDLLVRAAVNDGTIHSDSDGLSFTEKLRSEAGLDLPFLPRHLLWTLKALSFNWGRLDSAYVQEPSYYGQSIRTREHNLVLQTFPNTLLLIGAAYLLVFLIGMPLALYLARNHGSRLDRLITILSPISSVPSWVFAVLLIVIFAVQLHWLPVTGMFDFHKPDDPIEYTWTLLRHMILPVSALVLSLLFQLVYTWRTFFIIYSQEDYVDLARAKGLANRILERQYILKPALPYIITSFATSLIGFWQLTIALEVVFQWPGVGLLYIKALPNFWKESMQIGDLMIVIQIVVIFAYLLGMLVFILDIAYVMVDPRIHLIPASQSAQSTGRVKMNKVGMKGKSPGLAQPVTGPAKRREISLTSILRESSASFREVWAQGALFFRELRAYPSAIFGLAVLAVMLLGSIYAVTSLPYEQFGRDYDAKRATGHSFVPSLAKPAWLNIFSNPPSLSRMILDENSREASVTTRLLDNGWVEKTITFTFDYAYKEIPSDVFLYLSAPYKAKLPYISLTWRTPDGKSIDLKSKAVSSDMSYDFQSGISVSRLLNTNPQWKNWFVLDGQYPTPAFTLLFAKPGSAQPAPQQGNYTLEIKSLLFEKDSDLRAQLVLLGQVYGVAGTDYWRRDLIVPLFWGMPFALLVGFLGTLVTTLGAMLLPAIGVWFGGWLDNFIQRLTEINMVLPGLAIIVLMNALFGTSIWIVLGTVVLLNAFGAPIKNFRSAFLQAKEAPYIEMARSYGASNYRIITRYLVPRILPVFIPQLVTQIPSFIFLEATLGFFNIKSDYPSWGRIIYEGLARGALYGSPFWVLEPIFLLLLTGLAFAMLGSALERILNPRLIADLSAAPDKTTSGGQKMAWANFNRRLIASAVVMLLLIAVFLPTIQGKTLARVLFNYIDQTIKYDPRIKGPSAPLFTKTPQPALASTPTEQFASPTAPPPTLTPTLAALPTFTSTTSMPIEPISTPTATASPPLTYILHAGEYPYCIARRFNVDPNEMLTLNRIANNQTFFTGAALQIPQTGNPFPGERMLMAHPTAYKVSTPRETLYTIACKFGDVDPLALAQANNIPVDSQLFVGQLLDIP